MARFDSGVRFDSGARFDEPSPAPNNMSQNLISQTMTDVQRDAMITDLTNFDTKFNNYKCPLTPEQIRRMPKLSMADVGVLQLAVTFAQQNPTAIPGTINLTELANDLALGKQIIIVDAITQQKADMTKCSAIAALSDAYKAALDIYRIAQAQGRTPQNMTFLDEFGARFAHSPQPAKQPAP